jgi:DNA polymerase-2
MRLAELSGYEVLHGIVDSLWLKPRRSPGTPERLAERIEQKTGLPISIEGVYRWLVLLPNKHSAVGALNRYYGLFEDHTMKVRGIELRKHDTPRFLRDVQREMLQVLARAANGEEFLRQIPNALAVAAAHKRRLRERAVAPADLVFTRRISKGVEEYRQFNHQNACLRQLARHGVVPLPGQSVRFVVTNARSRDWAARVCAAELLNDKTPVDAAFYGREVDKMTETMFDFRRVAPHALT